MIAFTSPPAHRRYLEQRAGQFHLGDAWQTADAMLMLYAYARDL